MKNAAVLQPDCPSGALEKLRAVPFWIHSIGMDAAWPAIFIWM
jgi:hypothetical protein